MQDNPVGSLLIGIRVTGTRELDKDDEVVEDTEDIDDVCVSDHGIVLEWEELVLCVVELRRFD